MSTLTADGRTQVRDWRRSRISRKLRDDASLAGVPAHQRDTLSELKLVGKDLYADIRQRGIILPDGSINPSVAEHRQNVGAQLRFVLALTELKHNAEPVDLVAAMAQALEASAADVAEAASDGAEAAAA